MPGCAEGFTFAVLRTTHWGVGCIVPTLQIRKIECGRVTTTLLRGGGARQFGPRGCGSEKMSPGNVKLIQLREAQPRRWIHNHQSPVGQGQKPWSLPLFVGNSYLRVCISGLSWQSITSNEVLMEVSPLPPTNWPFSPFWTYRNNNSCYLLGIYYMLFFPQYLSIKLICQRENHRPQVSSLC